MNKRRKEKVESSRFLVMISRPNLLRQIKMYDDVKV